MRGPAPTTTRPRGLLPAEDLAWVGVIPAAATLLIALAWLAPRLSGLYPDAPYPFYPEWDVQPEPLEATRFILAIAVPAALAGAVLALGSDRPARRGLLVPIVCLQLAVCGFVVWQLLEQSSNSLAPALFGSFDEYLLPTPVLAAGPVIGLALTVLALSWNQARILRLRELAGQLGDSERIVLALAVVFTAIWLLPGVYTAGNLAAGASLPASHGPWQLNELAAAVNGRTPLVDYVPAYSVLLPIALSPLMSSFDSSITAFTLIMCLLSLIGLVAVYGAFREVTRRAWPALALYAPFVAITLAPWQTRGDAWEFIGSYYPVMPERYLGAFLVLWLLARHLRRGSPPVWALFFAAGLGLFVNVEFGVPCLVALAVALPLGAERDRPFGAWIRARAAPAALGLTGAAALVLAVILLRSGEIPDPTLLTYFAELVGRGFSLAPMPEMGFHWILYATYTAALLVAAVRYVKRSPDHTLTGMLAFAGMFGLGTGGYFAGRSLPWQLWSLFPAWALALALLGATAWLALRAAAGDRDRRRRVLVAAFTALAGFGVMVAAIARFPTPWQQIERISSSGPDTYARLAERRFIESRTAPGDHVLILTLGLEHRIAEQAGVVNVSPWYSFFGFASSIETDMALDQLEEEGGDQVFLGSFLEQRIAVDLLRRHYELVETNPASALAEWRRADRAQPASPP